MRREIKDAFDQVARLQVLVDAHAEHEEVEKQERRTFDALLRASSVMTNGKAHPNMLRMDGVAPRPVEWLWKPYVPVGKITLLDGDPGSGKSTIIVALFAAVTNGWPLPNVADGKPTEKVVPGNVLYFVREDDPEDTIRPRLDAAGVDCSRVVVVNGRKAEEGKDSPPISFADLALIDEAAQEVKPVLTVFDPYQEFAGDKVDINRANETRPALSALKQLAARHRTALLINRHLAKAVSSKALYRGLGSIDIVGAARSQLAAFQHPETLQRALIHVKSSVAREGPSVAYEIEGHTYSHEGLSIETSRILWKGLSDLRKGDMQTGESPRREPGPSLSEAIEWLEAFLAEGPRPQNEVEEAAKADDISRRTLDRAKKELDIRSVRTNEPGARGTGRWVWQLPLKA